MLIPKDVDHLFVCFGTDVVGAEDASTIALCEGADSLVEAASQDLGIECLSLAPLFACHY